MRRFLILLVVVLTVAVGLALRPGATYFEAETEQFTQAIPYAQTPADRGIIQFAFGDWGGLSSDTLEVSAAPWKLTTAALALAETDGDPNRVTGVDMAAVFRQWGIHSPQTIGNWPDHIPVPEMTAPLGQITGYGTATWPPIGATIGNAVCAACHSSVTYDANGAPDTSRVWLGMPNTSVNLDAYVQALFTALRDGPDNAALIEAMLEMYPETTLRERLTLQYAILPKLRELVAERDAAYGQLLPFRLSINGATNGLDSLRRRLDLIPEGEMVTASTFNSVPDLGGRLFRRDLLFSGSYTLEDAQTEMTADMIDTQHRDNLAAMIGYFTVPAMGVSPEVAEAHWDDARDVVAWLEIYAPQPYPTDINMQVAAQGMDIFEQNCASCHGYYGTDLEHPTLTRFPNWHGEIGTDPERSALVTAEFVSAANATLYGDYRARQVTGYSAPPLIGIWASAPYLHNGSVPTLWHLMHPEQRPERFMVGGHRIDLERVGVELTPPIGYVPWAIPGEVDTSQFGMSSSGHLIGFDALSEADKTALLEYLKLL